MHPGDVPVPLGMSPRHPPSILFPETRHTYIMRVHMELCHNIIFPTASAARASMHLWSACGACPTVSWRHVGLPNGPFPTNAAMVYTRLQGTVVKQDSDVQ